MRFGDKTTLPQTLHNYVKVHFPIQSVGNGCQQSIFSRALWLSKVISVFLDAFESINPLFHSGVVTHSLEVYFSERPISRKGLLS